MRVRSVVLSALAAVILVIVVYVGWVATTFTAQTLPVPPDFEVTIPEAHPPAEMTIAALSAGKIFADAALAFRGGSFSDERVFVVGGILVRHPQGTVLFDAGFGSNVDVHATTNPWLARSRADKDEEGVRKAIVHMHQLQKAVPGLTVVPAHDRRVWDTLPRLQIQGSDGN